MNVFWTTTMLGAGAVMLWSTARYKKGYPRMKGIAIASIGVVLACALLNAIPRGGKGKWREIEIAYARCRAEVLARYLVEKTPNARVLVIQPPSAQVPAEERSIDFIHEAILEGLRRGFGDSAEIVAQESLPMPELPKGRNGTETMPGFEMELPPEMWITAEAFDTLIDDYAGKCDVIVSTIGLPADFREMQFWHKTRRPKLAVLNAPAHERDLAVVLRKRMVVGIVSFSPDAVFDEKMPPADLSEAFAKRYLLITPENVEELGKKYPEHLFVN